MEQDLDIKKPRNIGLITFPLSKAGNIPLSNLANVLGALSTCLYVITGNKANIYPKKPGQRHIYMIDHKEGANAPARVINYIRTQLRMSYQLARLTRDVNLWIFFIGGETLLLPVVTAKLLRRRVVLASAGFPARFAKEEKVPFLNIAGLVTKLTLALSDRIILYSERIVAERNLEKHRNKISIAGEHFLDFNAFKIQAPLSKRGNLVGYIGGLSQAKGTPNLIDAIPKILEREGSVHFLIGGEGQLTDKLEERLGKEDLRAKVKLTGWIPHNDLPKYLNELKLLILPSYTEGLPNIILEAMACGTPVLATAVGAIPDVIKDGETGFIMEDNSPDGIARNTIRALSYPDLEKIARNARALVEQEFTYQAAVARYRKILDTLDNKQNRSQSLRKNR